MKESGLRFRSQVGRQQLPTCSCSVQKQTINLLIWSFLWS